MSVVGVGATGKVCHYRNSAVGDDANASLDADRADKARDATERVFDFIFAGETESANPFELASFDFIQFMVAA